MSIALTPAEAPPIVAVFADADVALDAVAATRATFVTSPAPGVVVLRERLYAAGAAVVVA